MVMGSYGTEMNTLMISSTAVERVSTYKLLGVVVSSNLKWEDHVSAITSKAARRIWFLKKLKLAGASVEVSRPRHKAAIASRTCNSGCRRSRSSHSLCTGLILLTVNANCYRTFSRHFCCIVVSLCVYVSANICVQLL